MDSLRFLGADFWVHPTNYFYKITSEMNTSGKVGTLDGIGWK